MDKKEFNPRIAIVISHQSYDHQWNIIQMSAQGWTGISHLAGLPYDNLFLTDLPELPFNKYVALIITQCTHVSGDIHRDVKQWLEEYLNHGGNLIIDGPFALYDENGSTLPQINNEMLSGIQYNGFYGSNSYRIKVANNHLITKKYAEQSFVTQHLVNGINRINFSENGIILLELTDEESSYPYISVRDIDSSRVMLVSDFATYSGATSIFRNVHPQVFYKNELINILINGLQWIVYGDTDLPIPAPQLSNANLTSIIRLDADVSGNLDAQTETISYLIDIAKESGVVPVYAWVSSGATRAGWKELAPLGRQIEELGGRIGTHSKYHRIDGNMNPERWSEELDGSIDEIETNTAAFGYPVKGVEYMINPGNTIRMHDYDEVSRRMSFFMTHGFEQNMPVGFGNMTWFTGDENNFVVINNTPSPDYQWFNDPTWSYTTAQITAFQESIFDHLFTSIGRGLVYNQMWHDYAITTLPQSPKDRIINESNIAMYNAMRAKFIGYDIYASEPEDLGHKIRAMKQWEYTWNATSDSIEIIFDLSKVLDDSISEFIGGMGIRIDNTRKYIHKVTVNGDVHIAFNDNTVILPNFKKGINTVRIKLDDTPSTENRLIYISKRMPEISEIGGDIGVRIITNARARFAFSTEKPAILIHADFQEWNRRGDFQLRGYVNTDRTVILRESNHHQIGIRYSSVPIYNFSETDNTAVFHVEPNPGKKPIIKFVTEREPERITLNNIEIPFSFVRSEVQIELPSIVSDSHLVIHYDE